MENARFFFDSTEEIAIDIEVDITGVGRPTDATGAAQGQSFLVAILEIPVLARKGTFPNDQILDLILAASVRSSCDTSQEGVRIMIDIDKLSSSDIG